LAANRLAVVATTIFSLLARRPALARSASVRKRVEKAVAVALDDFGDAPGCRSDSEPMRDHVLPLDSLARELTRKKLAPASIAPHRANRLTEADEQPSRSCEPIFSSTIPGARDLSAAVT